jgi:hypothetical protein
MVQVVLVILAAATSTGALAVGVRALGLRRSHLRPAAGGALECVGTMLIFFAANLTLGLVVILAGRSWTGAFVSTYLMSDVALLGVSCLQGLLFHCWRLECRGVSAESRALKAQRRRSGETAHGARREREPKDRLERSEL